MPKRGRDWRLEKQLGAFLRQYRRRRHAGHDPNDRTYDREVEEKLKRLAPEQLDRLLRDENES